MVKRKIFNIRSSLGCKKKVNDKFLRSMVLIYSPEVALRRYEVHLEANFINANGNTITKALEVESIDKNVTVGGRDGSFGSIVAFPELNLTYNVFIVSRANPTPQVLVESNNFNIYKVFDILPQDNLNIQSFEIKLYLDDDLNRFKSEPIVTLTMRTNCPMSKKRR